LPTRLRLALLVLASVFALLIVSDRARAAPGIAGLVVSGPTSGRIYVDGASTVTVEWLAGHPENVAVGANSPKITFTSETSGLSRTVRVFKTVSSLLLPASATRDELAARTTEIYSVEPIGWPVGQFLPPDTYDMTMTVYDPANPTEPSGVSVVSGINIVAPCGVGSHSPDGYVPGYVPAVPCTPASLGHYVDTSGATGERDCPVGTFANQVGASGCLPSPAGFFVAGPGAESAQPCPAGSYQPEMGQFACLPAPRGSFVAASGAERAMPCAAGSYQPQQGQVDCLVAPENSYVDSDPPVSTASCPVGTTSARGSSSLADCIDPQVLMDKSVRPACRVAVRKIISAACVAKSLNVSLVGAQAVVLLPVGTKQTACRAVGERIRTIAAGSCKVVLIVRPKHGKTGRHRASVTVTR